MIEGLIPERFSNKFSAEKKYMILIRPAIQNRTESARNLLICIERVETIASADNSVEREVWWNEMQDRKLILIKKENKRVRGEQKKSKLSA